jgi:hypothetical protein
MDLSQEVLDKSIIRSGIKETNIALRNMPRSGI